MAEDRVLTLGSTGDDASWKSVIEVVPLNECVKLYRDSKPYTLPDALGTDVAFDTTEFNTNTSVFEVASGAVTIGTGFAGHYRADLMLTASVGTGGTSLIATIRKTSGGTTTSVGYNEFKANTNGDIGTLPISTIVELAEGDILSVQTSEQGTNVSTVIQLSVDNEAVFMITRLK